MPDSYVALRVHCIFSTKNREKIIPANLTTASLPTPRTLFTLQPHSEGANITAKMTSEQLYGILKFLDALDRKLGTQSSLEMVGKALNNLVSSPAQPNFQSALAEALKSLTAAAAEMADSITPSQFAAIERMGGQDFFDPEIATKVNESVQTHAMTPSVPRDFVRDLADRREEFLDTVRTALAALEKLGLKANGLKPGTADVAFLIPRNMFDNELRPFAKELTFISRLIEDITEARTGKPQPALLEELSSSVPTVALIAALPALGYLGSVINKYLEAWERIEKIRRMREELAALKLRNSKTALQELDDEIKSTVQEVVEESTELIMKNYKGTRGDLTNAIRADMCRLFGQIERGLKVEFKVNADGEETANQKVLEQIASVARQLKFPEVPKEPLLLNSAEVIEDLESDGSVQVKHTKKTTIRKIGNGNKPPAETGKAT